MCEFMYACMYYECMKHNVRKPCNVCTVRNACLYECMLACMHAGKRVCAQYIGAPVCLSSVCLSACLSVFVCMHACTFVCTYAYVRICLVAAIPFRRP